MYFKYDEVVLEGEVSRVKKSHKKDGTKDMSIEPDKLQIHK